MITTHTQIYTCGISSSSYGVLLLTSTYLSYINASMVATFPSLADKNSWSHSTLYDIITYNICSYISSWEFSIRTCVHTTAKASINTIYTMQLQYKTMVTAFMQNNSSQLFIIYLLINQIHMRKIISNYEIEDS